MENKSVHGLVTYKERKIKVCMVWSSTKNGKQKPAWFGHVQRMKNKSLHGLVIYKKWKIKACMVWSSTKNGK